MVWRSKSIRSILSVLLFCLKWVFFFLKKEEDATESACSCLKMGFNTLDLESANFETKYREIKGPEGKRKKILVLCTCKLLNGHNFKEILVVSGGSKVSKA